MSFNIKCNLGLVRDSRHLFPALVT